MPIISYPTFTSVRAADYARFNVEVGAAQLARYVSWGQVFPKGKVLTSTFLKTKIGTHMSHPAQMDVRTKYDDGTVKLAIITASVPALPAGSTHARLVPTTVPNKAPVDLANALLKYDAKVVLSGDITATIDIKTKLIGAGAPDYYLKGALATQARVSVPIFKTLRLVADVTAYADGTFLTDLQLCNDISMQGSPDDKDDFNYAATITQNGKTVYASPMLKHWHYEKWRWTFHSTDFKPTHGDTHNVQHDISAMIAAGALPNYDLTSGIDDASIGSVPTTNIPPLTPQGVFQNMPNTGGRDDIGPTTAWNARWLKSQGRRAAMFALAQANVGGIPWHHWGTDDYLSLDDHPTLWIDEGNRGNGEHLTQPVTDKSWAIDTAHTPSLSFIPYLFTGERYYLDGVNAQATAVLMRTWADARQDGKGLVVNTIDQVRAQAWSLRAIAEAAWANPDVTKQKTYWTKLLDNNLNQILGIIIPEYNIKAGEAAGYIFGDYRNPDDDDLALGCFQQEFMISVMTAIAARGEAKALAILKWMQNWAIGRFTHQPSNGWRAAVAYVYHLSDAGGTFHDTWAKLGAANDQGNAFDRNEEYWVPLAVMTLANLRNINGNPDALKVYNAIMAMGMPSTTTQIYQTMYPQYHVVPAKR